MARKDIFKVAVGECYGFGGVDCPCCQQVDKVEKARRYARRKLKRDLRRDLQDTLSE
jgi:hypothetical protein